MKKTKTILIFILTVLVIQTSFGQVAIIQDPDGWTNVRAAPDAQSEVIHKLNKNDAFWYDPQTTHKEQNWISVYIPKNSYCLGNSEPNYIGGFIHKSRLLPLEKLGQYSGDGFLFQYQLSDFDSTNRIIDKNDGKWIAAIDGRPIWGTDGDLPRTRVDGINVKINGEEIQIHKVFFSDIYECDNELSIFKNGETYFVHQWNSDGAGAYEIVWVLNKQGLKQRLVGTIN